MHLIWSNPDILRSIIDEYQSDYDRPKTLASLACTCKAFYEIAMNDLWAVLDDVSPLVMCMSERAWRRQLRVGGGNGYMTAFVSAYFNSPPTHTRDANGWYVHVL